MGNGMGDSQSGRLVTANAVVDGVEGVESARPGIVASQTVRRSWWRMQVSGTRMVGGAKEERDLLGQVLYRRWWRGVTCANSGRMARPYMVSCNNGHVSESLSRCLAQLGAGLLGFQHSPPCSRIDWREPEPIRRYQHYRSPDFDAWSYVSPSSPKGNKGRFIVLPERQVLLLRNVGTSGAHHTLLTNTICVHLCLGYMYSDEDAAMQRGRNLRSGVKSQAS